MKLKFNNSKLFIITCLVFTLFPALFVNGQFVKSASENMGILRSDLPANIEGMNYNDTKTNFANALSYHSAVGFGDQPDVAVDSHGFAHIVMSRYKYFTCHYKNGGVAPNRYFVIQWETFHKTDGEQVKFQVQLYETGNVLICIENNSGAVGEYPITGINNNDMYGIDVGVYPPPDYSCYAFYPDGINAHTFVEIDDFFWLDVYRDNAQKPVWVERDDLSTWVPINFYFPFFDNAYTGVYVSSNGYLSFVDPNADEYSNPNVFPSGNEKASKVIAPLWDDWDPELKPSQTMEIYYSMVNALTGEVVITPTRISDLDEYNSTRPAVVVDSESKVHVTWQDERWDNGESAEIAYTKLNPYLDDQDGDPAIAMQIILIPNTRLTNQVEEWADNPRMAVDSEDDIHIVWENTYDGIYYMEIDNNAVTIVEPTLLRDIPDAWRTSVDVAVDSDDNPHIIWNDRKNTMTYEMYYMMLDGSDVTTKVATKIDATRLTEDDNLNSTGQALVVDNDDKVHAVWMDQRSDDAREIWHTKIDPAAASQDGSEADGDAITLIADRSLAYNSLYWAMNVACASRTGDDIHISFWTWNDKDIHYTRLNKDGNVLTGDVKITTEGRVGTNSDWMVPYIDVGPNNSAYITWFDWRFRGVSFAEETESFGEPNDEFESQVENIPDKVTLYQNYPNPFNPETTIRFNIDEPANVKIEIFDILGRRVRSLVNEFMSAGEFSVVWNAKMEDGLPAAGGLYIYKLSAGDVLEIKKMLLLK